MQETKENIRKQLYGFYIAYDLWLSNGAKPGGVFSRNYGLCANLFDYLTSIGTSSEAALEQLHADFRSAGLYEVLPFNESKGHYYEEKGNNMCHMNPARVAWVRAQIALVSLEAEPVAVNDDMAYAFHHALSDSSPGADEVEEIKAGLRAAFANVTVQPVLIVPDEMDLLTCHLDGVTETYADGWNACRVAMLQAGNFRENKNSSTNNFREIPETSTNSPGTPAGWISCSDAVPAEYCDVILRDDLGNVLPGSWDKVFCPIRGGNKMAFVDKDGVEVESPTHWMLLPEPPQEVNQ